MVLGLRLRYSQYIDINVIAIFQVNILKIIEDMRPQIKKNSQFF